MADSILVLFDIDGTIMTSGASGKSAFSSSLKEVFNVDDELSYITWAGATDLGVLEEIEAHNQCTLDCNKFNAFFETLGSRTAEKIKTENTLTVYPGVKHLIHELHKNPDIKLGLVTGNGKQSGYAKVNAAEVGDFFKFGGFGCEHKDRKVLAENALLRGSEQLGKTPDKVILIGDTPSDIQAAHHIGAIAVAVATGQHSLLELDEYEPAMALNDLSSAEMISLLLN